MEDMEKRSNFNAHELERLKKRFMKLDRCHSSPSPHPAALCCPLP